VLGGGGSKNRGEQKYRKGRKGRLGEDLGFPKRRDRRKLFSLRIDVERKQNYLSKAQRGQVARIRIDGRRINQRRKADQFLREERRKKPEGVHLRKFRIQRGAPAHLDTAICSEVGEASPRNVVLRDGPGSKRRFTSEQLLVLYGG